MPQSAEIARRVTERWILIAGATALVLGVLLGLLILARGNDARFVDAEWMEEIVEHRHPWWEIPSRIMDVLGGGLMSILISLTVVTLLFAIGRRWTALYFAIATLGSTLLVQTLKVIFGRARPEDILVTLDWDRSPLAMWRTRPPW